MDSLHNSAQLTMTARADVTALVAFKKEIEQDVLQRYGVKPTMTALIARAVVLALGKHPDMNCTIGELAKQIAQVTEKARNGTLAPEEMRGSTFTITNLGTYGIEWFTPILNPPETGILGVGATQPIPVYIHDQLERRDIMPLSLTFDHRVLDGAPAAKFLNEVKYRLEHPYSLVT
ncbi:catalytic domain-containing protein of components of various dehydrogenase complexes, partial [Caldalkalibacillus thermarum TA2.A1]